MVKDPEKALNSLIKGIDGLRMANDEHFKFERIPFGIPSLDKMLGGGVPRKRLTIFTGQPNGGKSYLTYRLIRSVQESGGTAVLIDTEMSLDSSWLEKNGVDTANLPAIQPTSGEEAIDVAKKALESGVDLVVLDSLAALATAREIEELDFNPQGLLARFISDKLKRLMSSLRYGGALVCVNQMRSSIGPVSFNEMPGGKAQRFYSHVILEVRRAGWIEDKGKKIGYDMEIHMNKTKVSSDHWDKVVVPFRVDGGIDVEEIYIREAIGAKLINRAGPWFSYKDDKVMGMNNLRAFFLENPDKLEELKKELEGTLNGLETSDPETEGHEAGTDNTPVIE